LETIKYQDIWLSKAYKRFFEMDIKCVEDVERILKEIKKQGCKDAK